MSTAAVAQKFVNADCDVKYAIPMADILAWTRRKIELANMLDAAAAD
jgi:hypothetical protein